MRHDISRKFLPAILLCLSLVTATTAAQTPVVAAPLNPERETKAFLDKVKGYLKLQKKAIKSLPSTPKSLKDPALIVERQVNLANAIRMLRPAAKPGDIFIPGVRPVITGIVKQKLAGPSGQDARTTVLGEGNPKSAESGAPAPVPVAVVVNATYPTAAPLSTVPPSLLMALPTLPLEVEYRFVGKNLILLDTKANLIVDFIANAF